MKHSKAVAAPGKSSRRAFLAATGVCAAAAFTRKAHSLLAAGDASLLPVVPASAEIAQFSPSGKLIGKKVLPRLVKSDAEWRKELALISYQVAREAGTERPYTGKNWDVHDAGLFHCICCDTAAFSSETKFDSGTGWPSFWEPTAHENVLESKDDSFGIERTAVSCRHCGAHLGHVFDDGPRPTGLRYCMNAAALNFVNQA